MSDGQHALWRRLDRPGHDTARLVRVGEGWALEGYAAFNENGETGLHYRVLAADDFATVSAAIEGHRDGHAFAHTFHRDGGEWHFDGAAMSGLADVLHIDFGFTPATNYNQLSHADLAVGDEAVFDVAWFDIGEKTLVRLPQQYHRIAEDRYWYNSPASGYEAVLVMAPNGFVHLYPDLWKMESLRG